jgi:Ca2+-binding RTX toxin-like protein
VEANRRHDCLRGSTPAASGRRIAPARGRRRKTRKETTMAYVIGTSKDETLDASDGITNDADWIFGDDGDDWIYGLGGDDIIKGGGGADYLYGDAGNDTAAYNDSPEGVSVSLLTGGGADGDVLFDIENLTGSAYDDSLIGDDTANELRGLDGDDYLNGGEGNDSLYGDTDDDTLRGDEGADTLDGGDGHDTATYQFSSAGVVVSLIADTAKGGDAEGDTLIDVENLIGSSEGDWLEGDDAANVLDGGSGNDTLKGFGGDDTLLGAWDNDTLKGGGGADVLDGQTGNDTADYSDSPDYVVISLATGEAWGGDADGDTLLAIENLTGSDHDDWLEGDDQINELRGLGGNDTLIGGADADYLDGGEGVDTVSYATSARGVDVRLMSYTVSDGDAEGDRLVSIENVIGSGSDDWLEGDETANMLAGLSGNNIFYGEGGDDILLGGANEDYFNGGAGADYLYGDAGTDEASYLGSDEAVRVSLLTGTGAGGDAAGDTLLLVENLGGSSHDDTLTGDHASNWLFGHLGNDTLSGLGSDDTLWAGDNDDTLEGGSGGDSIDGGEGVDTASYENSSEGVRVSLRDDTAAGGDAEGDTLDGIENLSGSAYADILWGDNGDNVLSGFSGRHLRNDGRDLIGDNDTLYGLEGADTLDGGTGADVLDGGEDADIMLGGSGNDAYFVDDAADVVTEYAGEGIDSVNATISYTLTDDVENLTLAMGAGALDGTGNARDNTIIGNEATNVLRGHRGADTLDGREGGDTMVGGLGNDTYFVDDAADVVTEQAGEGTDLVHATITYQLGSHVEDLTLVAGSAARDGTGNGRDNVLTGNELDNVLSGRGGIDTLDGGDGRDTLDGGAGADTMIGGDGDDTYIVSEFADVVTEAVGEGYDVVRADRSYSLAAGSEVEALVTTDEAGTLFIDLSGNEFDNWISGNAGRNIITGGLGRDEMYGRDDGDTFVWASVAETGQDINGADVIGDFNASEGDRIDLSLIDADETTTGVQDFTFLGEIDSGSDFAAPGQFGYFTDGVDVYLRLNTDADPGHDAVIWLRNTTVLDASSFVL